jgi:GNAT superfamily N-acetyltransferase
MPEEHLPLVAGHIAGHDEVWVAEEAGRILGFLAIDGGKLLAKLYVEPDAQNRGVGAALLDQAKTLCPEGLELWVFQRNEGARRFYERHGFRPVELTDGADNWEKEPDALYAWP